MKYELRIRLANENALRGWSAEIPKMLATDSVEDVQIVKLNGDHQARAAPEKQTRVRAGTTIPSIVLGLGDVGDKITRAAVVEAVSQTEYSPRSIDSALSHLTTDGILQRVSPGVYKILQKKEVSDEED